MLPIGTQVVVKTSRGNQTATINTHIAKIYMTIIDCEDPYFNYKLIDMDDVVKVVKRKVTMKEVKEMIKDIRNVKTTRIYDGVAYENSPLYNTFDCKMLELAYRLEKFSNFYSYENVEESFVDIRNKNYTILELMLYK